MFLAFGTAILVYTVGTAIMVGVVSADVLAQDGGDLTPVATVARVLVGPWGAILMTGAAVLAFSSVANAGILSASRYPLAMSRDHLIPGKFSKLTPRNIPHYGIAVTVGLIIFLVMSFDIASIAKLASAFQLLMFALICFAVIVMRESRIEAYDPGYRSPFYPWLQIFGIASAAVLIFEMGIWSLSFTLGLGLVGVLWFIFYGRNRVHRTGAGAGIRGPQHCSAPGSRARPPRASCAASWSACSSAPRGVWRSTWRRTSPSAGGQREASNWPC